MELTTVWFVLITVLWVGYFCLEGFDFGVGILLPVLGRGDTERRVLINTIAPVWDGNEVWLLVAAGATFAAFPYWYATLFSGFYVPLLLILLALIGRGVAFEFRHKRPGAAWKSGWDAAIFVGSFVPTVLWGVAFTNMVVGVPIDEHMVYTGSVFTLLNPLALLGGLVTLALFVTHGATFIALKTEGDIRIRARAIAWKAGIATGVLAGPYLLWVYIKTGTANTGVLFFFATVFLVAGILLAYVAQEGLAFTATFLTIACVIMGLFVALFPEVMPSSTDPEFSLTTTNAAATAYTLKVITWVAVIFTPLVLVYQSWTYWVFRKRIGTRHIPSADLAH